MKDIGRTTSRKRPSTGANGINKRAVRERKLAKYTTETQSWNHLPQMRENGVCDGSDQI